MQERTVWPCNALNQREGADKRRSIWSPNGPRDPLSLQQYLPGISRCWFGQGSCTASLPWFHLHRAHVTKINIEIEADVTLGHCLRSGSRSVEVWQQQVKFAILCKVCVLTAMITFHRLCFLLSAFLLECTTPRGVCLWLQIFFKSTAAYLKGIKSDVQLFKKLMWPLQPIIGGAHHASTVDIRHVW